MSTDQETCMFHAGCHDAWFQVSVHHAQNMQVLTNMHAGIGNMHVTCSVGIVHYIHIHIRN